MKPGIYRHYKGNDYQVIGLAHHVDTRETLILYKALNPCPDLEQDVGLYPFFVRSSDEFNSPVFVDGMQKQRFEFIRE